MTQRALAFAWVVLLVAGVCARTDVSRTLLQRSNDDDEDLTPAEREAAREAAALAAHALEQERKANESALIIEQARVTSEESVQLYLAANHRGKLEVLTDLLKNADGVAFKFMINTLSGQGGNRANTIRRHAHRAIGSALRDGFATNVAEAIAYAFLIKDNDFDHLNLLDVIVFRQRKLEEQETGAGCTFVKNLLQDADLVAHSRGDSMPFVANFQSEEHLPVMECFLDTCTGAAARCCSNNRALRRGQCGCRRDQPNRCDYNIFLNLPRTIWVCSTRDCAPNQKCLCPAAE